MPIRICSPRRLAPDTLVGPKGPFFSQVEVARRKSRHREDEDLEVGDPVAVHISREDAIEEVQFAGLACKAVGADEGEGLIISDGGLCVYEAKIDLVDARLKIEIVSGAPGDEKFSASNTNMSAPDPPHSWSEPAPP